MPAVAAPELPKLEIVYVRRIHESCPKCRVSQPFVCRSCGHQETVDDLHERQMERLAAPVSDAERTTDRGKPAAVASAEVIPIRRSIHDAPNAPLKPPAFTEPWQHPPGGSA